MEIAIDEFLVKYDGDLRKVPYGEFMEAMGRKNDAIAKLWLSWIHDADDDMWNKDSTSFAVGTIQYFIAGGKHPKDTTVNPTYGA